MGGGDCDTSATLSPQYDEKVDCHDSAKAKSRDDEKGVDYFDESTIH